MVLDRHGLMMALSIMDNGCMVLWKDMASWSIPMGIFMKGNGRKESVKMKKDFIYAFLIRQQEV